MLRRAGADEKIIDTIRQIYGFQAAWHGLCGEGQRPADGIRSGASLKELMQTAPTEQHQQEQRFQMGEMLS